jgi:DNA-binding GntR family transcriptional regulator
MALMKHQTKTELALQVLRERIQSGELAPGQRLQLTNLPAELGMSPTPIREALRLLQADGLVLYRPHQGIVVAENSPDQIDELVRLRCLLEAFAVELAVPRLTPSRLAELERLHERLLRAIEADHGTAITKGNHAWHWAIYETAESPVLLELIRRLWDAYPWRTMWVLPGRAEQSAHEHESVMEAIRRGDGTEAARRMGAHVGSGKDSLLARLVEHGSRDERS